MQLKDQLATNIVSICMGREANTIKVAFKLCLLTKNTSAPTTAIFLCEH